MGYYLVALVIVLFDQWSKLWVLENIPLYGNYSFLPPLMDLTYVQNTGAAFSVLSGRTELLALVSLVLSFVLGYTIHKKLFDHPLAQWSLTLILGGAIGNLIDRAFRGYVVDMFQLLFVRFAIFNVADAFVVVGGLGMAVYYVFLAPPEEESTKDSLGDSTEESSEDFSEATLHETTQSSLDESTQSSPEGDS